MSSQGLLWIPLMFNVLYIANYLEFGVVSTHVLLYASWIYGDLVYDHSVTLAHSNDHNDFDVLRGLFSCTRRYMRE